MKKKYFITGGSGFIGSAIVKNLINAGHQITVLDNNSRGSKEKIGDFFLNKIKFIEGDIRDPKSFSDLEDFDSIIHLAYVNGTKYFYEMPYDILDIAIRGMINVLDAIKKFNVPQLILASSSEVYQSANIIPTPEDIPLTVPDIKNPRYSYGGGKIACELLAINYARQYNLDIRIFRPHNVYGPNMGFEHVIPEICKKIFDAQTKNLNQIKIQGDGLDTRAFIYIDDFVEGVDIILDKGSPNEIYHIGSTQEITIRELFDKFINFSNGTFELVSEPRPLGSTNRRCPDTKKLNDLGFKTATSLDVGLKSTYEWYIKKFKETGMRR